MKTIAKFAFTTFILISLTTSLAGQKKQINNILVYTIDSLHKADQDCALIKPGDSAAAKFQRVIRTNFPIVKAILENYGFPGYDLVGKGGSDKYFLLVQHSDFDVEFQKKVLKLMKKHVKRNNATGTNYAYLVDRIEINTGKPQIYGTQVQMGQSGTKLKPCIDTANLDKRRKSVGLIPIKQYLQKCDETFKELNPTLFKKKD